MTIFSDIYRDNLWNGVESRSGPGSGQSATANVAPAIVRLVEDFGWRSVLDVACGDGYWMPDLPGYQGVDVAPEAIRLARERHPDRHYRQVDMCRTRLGPFDLAIVRDVVQHLPLADGMAMLAAVTATGSSWLLASTYIGGTNEDIEAGGCYAPDLSVAPFGLGQPERLIFDGYAYDGPDDVRDPRKHLGLWAL